MGIAKGVTKVTEEVDVIKYASDWINRSVFKDIVKEKNELILNRDLVREKVDAIDQKIEMVNDVVFEWLSKTEILIQQVENLSTEPNPSPQSWNAFLKLLMKLVNLNLKCEFDPFSTPIPSLEHFSSGNIVCFKSTEKISDELLEALKDDKCCMIGLYGRQGCGKTTLVKAMGEKIKFLSIFHEVLYATVTQNPNIRAMQDEIADSLNMKFDRNSEAGRARRIFSIIENMDRPILVIFDDVQVKFNPEDVGIPCNSNRCKVLLITRRQQDCDLMYCQRKIHLGLLSTEEAWILFKKHSGIQDESSSFHLLNVARKVALECEGLPRTIKGVGSSLRSKSIEEWKVSLDSLLTRWQIFLNFRGEDTRDSFTGSLYNTLDQGGFKTFIDDKGMHPGDRISPTLLSAIEASRLSIIVLSENYANSTCLVLNSPHNCLIFAHDVFFLPQLLQT